MADRDKETRAMYWVIAFLFMVGMSMLGLIVRGAYVQSLHRDQHMRSCTKKLAPAECIKLWEAGLR